MHLHLLPQLTQLDHLLYFRPLNQQLIQVIRQLHFRHVFQRLYRAIHLQIILQRRHLAIRHLLLPPIRVGYQLMHLHLLPQLTQLDHLLYFRPINQQLIRVIRQLHFRHFFQRLYRAIYPQIVLPWRHLAIRHFLLPPIRAGYQLMHLHLFLRLTQPVHLLYFRPFIRQLVRLIRQLHSSLPLHHQNRLFLKSKRVYVQTLGETLGKDGGLVRSQI